MCKKNNYYAGSLMFCWLFLATNRITGNFQDNYIGCYYYDVNDQPGLPKVTLRNNTVELCIGQCRLQNSTYTYAGLKNSEACLCGNNFGVNVPDTSCNSLCPGNQSEYCGGTNRQNGFYSLYAVCEIGYYGYRCNQVCHCKRQAPCDRMTGKCPNECEEKWFGTTCSNTQLSQKYIGCFRDNEIRAIPGEFYYNPRMTIESCSNSCNNSIVGLQAAGHCFCGESYAKYGRRSEFDCSQRCTGNPAQKCGGAWANSVYYVCPIGFYGRNCINRCHCSDGGACRFNGSCLNSTLEPCKPGWTGSACNTRDCEINNGDCQYNEKCEIVDLGFVNLSMCRCKDGSYRDSYTCRPTSLHYVGCYKGSTNQYVAVEQLTSDTLTIEFCIQKCRQLNKTYSIIQDGVKCFCGDDYGQGIPDADCQVPCAGNKLQYCGGNNTINGTSIYGVYTAKSFLRQYMGCYRDTDTRAMDRGYSWDNGRNNTIDSCIKHCASHNYSYAGLQHGRQCFCGNVYDRHGRLPESSCDMKCNGDSSQTCGGGFANSVYAVTADILWCSNDTDCKWNENCNVIDLNYMNVSRCRCKQGFQRMGNRELCTDVDECKSGNTSCSPTSEKCVNNIGSYICECNVGFVNITGQCEDVDECKSCSSTCNPSSENCVNNIGSYRCECKVGFANRPTSGQCEDVDECQSGTSSCNPTSENCVNNIGSYRCECNVGFVNMCGQCEDVDECKWGNTSCNPTSENCVNSIGRYICECNVGFVNISGHCEDVDECKSDTSTCSPTSENCVNNIGSYRCECNVGFVNMSGHCEDVNECNSGNTSCNPTSENCVNNIGSYRCECKVGFVNISGHCEDVDECESGTSSCNPTSENCVNNIGGYVCECNVGFVNMRGHCEDVDECKSITSSCNPTSENCVNSIGSYICECNVGFVNMSGHCEDVDECKSGESSCNPTSENCVNSIGSYRCECKVIFVNMSGHCEGSTADVDECKSGTSSCNPTSENCVNSMGSYRCECNVGFVNMSGHCEDVDECISGTSSCNPTSENCINKIGNYICECNVGFVHMCGQCEDADECKSVTSSCNPTSENCVNNIGSFRCECNVGFLNMSGHCEDVDECKSGTSTCNPTSENCVNNIGSYVCECNVGWVNICGHCEDVDECKSGTSSCNPTSEKCVNSIGSYRCECIVGFVNMSGHCEDIDECQLDRPSSPCNAFSEYCVNSIGSYICISKEGFMYTCSKNEECNSSPTTGIILGTFLAISLLGNVLFIFYQRNKSRNSESGEGISGQSDYQRCFNEVSEQHENNYDDTPEPVGQKSINKKIIPEKRQVVLNPTFGYAALEQDD